MSKRAKYNRRTALYRHFDSRGRLLYVGISLSAVHRLEQHRQHAHWFSDIARVDVQWFANRGDALRAESIAIGEESPAHNLARPVKPRLTRNQPPADESRLAGVIHPRSGFVDGWYAHEASVIHMIGWFRAMFPRDQFETLTAADARRIGCFSNKQHLSSIEWERWASTSPDFAAADKYDRQAA